MARVAGLTPVERTGSGSVDRANGRADTPQNRPAPDLAPRASPVSTYSRPAQPQSNGDLEQLAKALSGLNPALDRYAAQYSDEEKKQAEAAAENKIGGMTFDEATKAVEEGSIKEMDSPWFKAAFMKQFGQRAALQKAGQVRNTYDNDFNKDGGDVEGLIASQAKPVLDKYGNDRHFTAGFNNAFEPMAAKLRMEQSTYRNQRTQGEVRQGVFEINTAIISEGIAQGQSADDIIAKVRSTYEGNKKLLNIPYADQDKEAFRVAELLTKGISTSKNPALQKEIVEKLLTSDRVAPDGYKLGSLSNKGDFAVKSQQLLDASDKELEARNRKDSFDNHLSWSEIAKKGELDNDQKIKLIEEHKANPGRYTDGQVMAMINQSDAVIEQKRAEIAAREEKVRAKQLAEAQRNEVISGAASAAGEGNLWAVKDAKVTDEHGNEKTMKADKVREEVRDRFLARSAIEAKRRGEDPVATFDREANWLGQNGMTNPQWESLLKSGYMQGTSASLSGSKLPPALEQASELYNQLHAKNPALLKAHIDDSSMDFYEAMRFGTQVAGFDKKTAAINAMEVNKDPTKYESPYWKEKFDVVDRAVKNVNNAWVSKIGAENSGEIAPQIERSAKYFAKLGASPEVAIQEAQKRVMANYTQVNGYLVPIGDRRIPTAFPEMAQRYIEDYAKKYGEKEGISASDITVQGLGNAAGQWRLVLKKSPGMIVDHPEGIFTMEQLGEFEKNRVEAERIAHIEANNKRRTERAADFNNKAVLTLPKSLDEVLENLKRGAGKK